jgi:hypothetical protein
LTGETLAAAATGSLSAGAAAKIAVAESTQHINNHRTGGSLTRDECMTQKDNHFRAECTFKTDQIPAASAFHLLGSAWPGATRQIPIVWESRTVPRWGTIFFPSLSRMGKKVPVNALFLLPNKILIFPSYTASMASIISNPD